MAMASPAAAALLLLRPPSCLTSVCASRTPLLAVASHRVKHRTILRGSARECFSSFLGASSFSRRSAVLQPELKNKKRWVTTARAEVLESQSASMTRAPDFEVHMFQILFPLPIFFLTDPLLWFLHEVWNICFWQSVELIGRNGFFALLLNL
jgi:hypothetical protein